MQKVEKGQKALQIDHRVTIMELSQEAGRPERGVKNDKNMWDELKISAIFGLFILFIFYLLEF